MSCCGSGGPVLMSVDASAERGKTARRTVLKLQGMTCAARVERALGRVPGVVSAHVNLATERAARPAEEGEAAADREKAARERDIRLKLALLTFSAVLSLPLVGNMLLELVGVHGSVLASPGLQFVLGTLVQFVGGRPSTPAPTAT